MRPATVSDDEILAAGRRLLDAGERINGYTLRREVGEKGMPKRLNDVWQRLNGEAAKSQADQLSELPLEIEEMLQNLNAALLKKTREMAGSIAQHAMRLADRRIAEICAQHEEVCARHEEELEDANSAIEEAEQKAARIQDELLEARQIAEVSQLGRNEAQRETSAALQQVTERDRALQHQEQRMAALETRLQSAIIELATSRAQESQTRVQLDEHKARLDDADNELSASHIREAQAQALLAEQKSQLAEHKDQLHRLQAEHGSLATKANTQRIELASQQEHIRSLKADLQRAEQASEQTRQDLGRQIALHEQARADLDSQLQVLGQQLEHSNRLLDKLNAGIKSKRTNGKTD